MHVHLESCATFHIMSITAKQGHSENSYHLTIFFIGANSHAGYQLVENQTMLVIKILNQLKEFWYIYL